MKGNCQFVKLSTGLYEIVIDGEIQWAPDKPLRTLKMSLEDKTIFHVAWCRFEHRSPVARVYEHIPANQLRFVVQSLIGPTNNAEILYIEKSNDIAKDCTSRKDTTYENYTN
jgi:hypothetical protein